MKRLLILLTLSLCVAIAAHSQRQLYYSPDTTVSSTLAQLRLEAGATRHLGRHATLALSEEVRVGTGGFDRSYTNLAFGYKFNNYFRLGADYTLMLINGSKKWKTRHRVGVVAAASVRAGRWKLTLRERPLLTLRTDSINSEEKNRANWSLRHKLTAEYNIKGRPLRPYLSVDLGHTLNAKAASGTDGTNTYTWDGNYIDKIRPTVGLKWKVRRGHELNFFYKFDYDYGRDYNIKKKSGKLQVVRETEMTHVVGVSYGFDWK